MKKVLQHSLVATVIFCGFATGGYLYNHINQTETKYPKQAMPPASLAPAGFEDKQLNALEI
jgi:hypothetical protein